MSIRTNESTTKIYLNRYYITQVLNKHYLVFTRMFDKIGKRKYDSTGPLFDSQFDEKGILNVC